MGHLAGARLAAGRLDEAVAAYLEALKFKSEFPQALTNLGIALREQGLTRAAELCYRKALTCDPEAFGALNNLGNLLLDQNQHEDALACFESNSSLWPVLMSVAA